MDRYTRFRGGSAIWTDNSLASSIAKNSFFVNSPINKFWTKISGVWKECVTWIKVSGVWKQATPKIKVTTNWK